MLALQSYCGWERSFSCRENESCGAFIHCPRTWKWRFKTRETALFSFGATAVSAINHPSRCTSLRSGIVSSMARVNSLVFYEKNESIDKLCLQSSGVPFRCKVELRPCRTNLVLPGLFLLFRQGIQMKDRIVSCSITPHTQSRYFYRETLFFMPN